MRYAYIAYMLHNKSLIAYIMHFNHFTITQNQFDILYLVKKNNNALRYLQEINDCYLFIHCFNIILYSTYIRSIQ